jgi:hypothetical protein
MANDPETTSESEPRPPREVANSSGGWLPLLSVYGCMAAGFAGVGGGVVLLGDARPGREFNAIGAGLCLIAGALGFGLLANALWRK